MWRFCVCAAALVILVAPGGGGLLARRPDGARHVGLVFDCYVLGEPQPRRDALNADHLHIRVDGVRAATSPCCS